MDEVASDGRPTSYFLAAAFVVLALILGYLLFPVELPENSGVVEYEYFVFEEVGGLWESNVNLGNQLFRGTFRFNPTQVEDVYVSGNFSGFVKSPIFITFDPEADSEEFKWLALGVSELSLHLVRALNFTVEAACTKNVTDACANRPVIGCDSDESVILLSPLAPAQITLDGDCVVLSGSGVDLLKSVDRLLFQWYKIMR